jgi:3-oxoacyl-[acyl-carrier protein] reductase
MKTIIITGGTKGLGLEITKYCLRDNFKVIAVSRNISPDFEVLLSENKGSLSFEPFDFKNISKIKNLAKKLCQNYGKPWGLINNAAVGMDGVLFTQHEKDISDLIRINIEAPILLTKYLVRPMILNRSGRLINISSIIASSGFNGLSVYGATKSSLLGFTKSLAREVGKMGITVNAIAPGYMETSMTAGIDEIKLNSIIRRSPLRRLAKTSEVAAVVSFLLSDDAEGITGTTITVDAGSTA